MIKKITKPKSQHKMFSVIDIIVSIILIVCNDEELVIERINKINSELKNTGVNYEILIVDNNSQDKTVKKIRELQTKIPFIRIIILSKTYETDIAYTAGLDSCIGDFGILFNLYTDPPSLLTLVLEKLIKDHDVVIGKTKKTIAQYGLVSRLFLWALQKFSSHNFVYKTNSLIGLNRKAINSIIRTRRKSRNFSYMNYLIGYRKYIFLYEPLKDYQHKFKKENFFAIFFNVTDILISNSYKPIRALTFLGMFASLLFLLYVIIISLIYFFINRSIAPQGWISIAFVMGTMFLLLFSILTLISEYLIRTLHETRNEPLYFVADEIDKSVILPEENKLNVV